MTLLESVAGSSVEGGNPSTNRHLPLTNTEDYDGHISAWGNGNSCFARAGMQVRGEFLLQTVRRPTTLRKEIREASFPSCSSRRATQGTNRTIPNFTGHLQIAAVVVEPEVINLSPPWARLPN